MATHKLLLDDFFEEDFTLLAIHTTLEPYRLAYFLNQTLNICLAYSKVIDNYELYEYEDEKNFTTWNLVSNKTYTIQGNQSSNSLFEAKTINYLIPEYKKADYFIKIYPENIDVNNILSKIKEVPQIITTFVVATENLKSKSNLIFY